MSRKQPEPRELKSAIADVKSEAWRDLLERASVEEVDAALEDVGWSQPRASEPGVFTMNATFSGRGKTKPELLRRLVAVLARARGPGLRERVTSMTLQGDPLAPLDAAPIGALPHLTWARLENAASISAIDALRAVPRLHLDRIADLDLAPLAGARFEELFITRSAMRGAIPRASSLRLVGIEGPVRADAEQLGLMPSAEGTTIGPVDGTAVELSVYNSRSLRALALGALPALRSLSLRDLPALRSLEGASTCPTLRRMFLHRTGLSALPALSAALEELDLNPLELEDAAALAPLVRLRKLSLNATKPPRGIAAVLGEMSALEHLSLRGLAFDEILPVLRHLPALRSLALRGYPLERVPDLDELAPQIEILSLEDCRGGFLEHDAIHRIPSLREVRLAGSTLEMHKKQLDPRIRKRGIRVRFDR